MDMDVNELYFLDARWNISFSILVCVQEQRMTTIPEYDMLLLVESNQFVCMDIPAPVWHRALLFLL